jgi:sugar fermentation stimulation protein A
LTVWHVISRATSSTRATPYTVEAISVDPPDAEAPAWIGINQNMANRFVECALQHGLLPGIVSAETLRREQFLGTSRLDFLVNDDTYVEVKTPLQNLQIPLGVHVRTRPHTAFDSTDRMVKHLGELGRSLETHQRAILLLCFLYDNPGFQVLPSTHHRADKNRVTQAVRRGVELWQVNFTIADDSAQVLRYHRLDAQFSGPATRKAPTIT